MQLQGLVEEWILLKVAIVRYLLLRPEEEGARSLSRDGREERGSRWAVFRPGGTGTHIAKGSHRTYNSLSSI